MDSCKFRINTKLDFKLGLLCAALIFIYTVANNALNAQTQQNPNNPETQNGAAVLQQRVKQLEEQFTDLQAYTATLQSLVKKQISNPAQNSPGENSEVSSSGIVEQSSQLSSADVRDDPNYKRLVELARRQNKRIQELETQVRALSSQMTQVTSQMQGLTRQSDASDAGASRFNDGDSPLAAFGRDSNQFEGADQEPTQSIFDSSQADSGLPNQQNNNNPVRADNSDPSWSQRTVRLPNSQSAPQQNASAEQLYDEAYGHMLRRDYEAAESTFRNFLKLHSKDKLAGNAQYWLGETYFVRGDYRKAADHFLKGYTRFRDGQKAPDSLLKLALSLRRLGQNDAACTTIAELTERFPKAPSHVKRRVVTESKRMGCS